MFGKFILQTPVEGGHEGGILQVGNSSEEAFYDFHSESDRLFYAAALLANCEHHWQPIERGNVVLLEFDLLWQPESALTISDLPLSSFLAASKLAEEALLTWKVNCQKIEEIEEGEIVSDIVATGSSGVSAPLSQDYAVPGCAKEEAPADASKDHLLIIPLVETYFETNFSFSSLRGRDRQMAHILQSVDFIDVHLAIVNQNLEKSVNLESRHWEVKEGFVQKSRSFQVAQWIYSNTSVPQFQRYNLELTNQLLGDVKTVLRSDGNLERMCRHPVLIIQPRHQSVRRCCTFQFDAILHHIEFRIPIDVNSKLMRRQSLACLGQILDYCQAEPFRVWDIPDAEISRRNRRLLKICQELQAQKEGLRLMALLCQGIYSSLQETKGCTAVFTLSVRNEIEARSIIEMVLNAGGNFQMNFPTIFSILFDSLLAVYRVARICVLGMRVDHPEPYEPIEGICHFGHDSTGTSLPPGSTRCDEANLLNNQPEFFHYSTIGTVSNRCLRRCRLRPRCSSGS